MGMTMSIQLSENLFGDTGPSGTMISSQSMFSAHDSAQATRPDSDLSSHPTRPSVYDDWQAPAPDDFERTLNQRIDSLERREEEKPDPSPRADVAARNDDRPVHRNEGTQEIRRSDPTGAADEPPSAKATRKESVNPPREGAKSQTPQVSVETKMLVDLPVHAVMTVTEKSSHPRTQVKSNPRETVGNGAETSDRSTLLASLRSREQGSGRRGVFHPEVTLKQHPKELQGSSLVKAQLTAQGAPKEVASVAKNQAGEMTQPAKAAFSGSVESNTAPAGPEKNTTSRAEGVKPAMGQTPSSVSGSGRLDLEGLKLQTLTQPHQVAAPAKQQPHDLAEANKGKPYEVLEDLPTRKSEPWVTRSGSAQGYLSGKRPKLVPSPTAVTPTLSTGGEQSSVLPKIGLAATPGSALVSPPVDAPFGEMPLTRAVPVKGTDAQLEALSTKDNSASVSKQIMESIHASVQHGQRRLTIALHPAELGRVVVTLEEENGSLSGRLEVSQKQTRAEIERALPGILQSLQSSGVQIKRLDVTLSNNGNDPGPRDSAWNNPSSASSSSHQSRRDRQEYQDAASQGPFDFAEEGLAAETHTVGDEQAPRPLFAGSGSIDLLV